MSSLLPINFTAAVRSFVIIVHLTRIATLAQRNSLSVAQAQRFSRASLLSSSCHPFVPLQFVYDRWLFLVFAFRKLGE